MKNLFYVTLCVFTVAAKSQTLEGCYLCCANMFQENVEAVESCVSACNKCESDDWSMIDCDFDDICETGVRYMNYKKCYHKVHYN
eukprot:snap_masked-scaffold_51-processed-gene-1.48-mRNA-1 protein AED:1.00 eAED:1.00 QI:0/-1/0/0/-1/1/1/0/84